MKYTEAFEKWYVNRCSINDQQLSPEEIWEACEDFFDKRECCNCKYNKDFEKCNDCYRAHDREDSWELK